MGIGLLVEGGAPIAFFPLSLLHLLNCLILLPDFSCFCSSYSLSHPTGSGGGGKGGSEQVAVCGCLAAGWGQPIASILFYCDVFLKNSFSFSYYLLINCSLLVFKRYFLFPPSPRTAFCLASSKSETAPHFPFITQVAPSQFPFILLFFMQVRTHLPLY